MTQIEPLLEETAEVDAPPAQVWALVSDLPRMASWSPQVVRTVVRGNGPIGLGTNAVNINRHGPLFWPTRSKVIRFEPHQEIALRIKDNKSIWSFQLSETDSGGTRVTQRREVPDGLSAISIKLTKVAFGGQRKFTEELRAGMRQTLARIKDELET